MDFLKPAPAEPQKTSDSDSATLRAELSWLKVGEHPFWKLTRMELAVRKLQIRRTNGVDSLFSASEIAARQNQVRHQALHQTRHGLLSRDENILDGQRKMSPIAALFLFLSRKLPFPSHRSPEPTGTDLRSTQHARKEKLAVGTATPIHLFSPDEVNAKLRPILIQLERRFRRL
jgi:hypothetical protein